MAIILAITASSIVVKSPLGGFELNDFFCVATFRSSCYFVIHLFLFLYCIAMVNHLSSFIL